MAEETVTKEAPKTFAEHFEAAKAAQSAQDQAPETPAGDDTTPEQQPAEETTPEDQPQESGDESILTEEELNLLSAKERAMAVKWQKRLTEKSQKLAEERKQLEARMAEYEPWKDWIAAINRDPHGAVRSMAQQLNMTIAEAQAVADAVTDDIPPTVKAKLDRLEAEQQKMRAEQEAAKAEAIAAETHATIEAFRAKHNLADDKAWAKHEKRLLEVGGKLLPAGGVMDMEYLDYLNDLVTLKATKAEQTKAVISKMQKSAEAAEKPKAGLSDAQVIVKRPPAAEITMEAAYAAAKRGERWE